LIPGLLYAKRKEAAKLIALRRKLMKVTWLGHSAFCIESEGKKVIIDPFVSENPKFPKDQKGLLNNANYMLLTHMHSDHLGDALELSKKTKKVVGIFEISTWLASKGAGNCEGMNIGGTIAREGLVIHMVPAVHSSGFVDNGTMVYGGNPTGYVIEFGGHRIYHAGDTGLFLDMQLIQRLYHPDICLLPIGDRYTMGPVAAAIACNEFFDAETIIPMHFDTFPILTGKSEEFRKLVKRGTVLVLEPGKPVEL
jgi:L-ascorbate metabolism protein UlaG (beta-lactamase superfamily)